MGWFSKKDDGLYRGDAPASAPGVDGVDPTAYLGNPAGGTYVQPSMGSASQYPSANPYQVGSSYPSPGVDSMATYPMAAYPTAPAPYQDTPTAGQPYSPQSQVPPPTQQPFSVNTTSVPQAMSGLPQEFAAAWGLAQSQQRIVRKTLTRSLMGMLLPLILVGGLVFAGFYFVDKVQDINPFSSGPGAAVEGIVGTTANVAVGDNTYDITVTGATAQPGAAWGSIFSTEAGGFLVVELNLTRTDSSGSVDQISWFDWTFTPDSGPAVEGALIAGGYEPLLSTLNLAPNETATGLIAFETPATTGTLSLDNFDGTWAQWPIEATVPAPAVGQFGVPIHPEVANTPFSATVANPRWVATGDPAIWVDPASGNYLVFDVSVTLDEGALSASSSLSIGYDSWQFVPDGGTGVSSYIGVTGADGLTFSAGQPTAAATLIAFDTPRTSGTLNLVNADGSVVASWVVPPL